MPCVGCILTGSDAHSAIAGTHTKVCPFVCLSISVHVKEVFHLSDVVTAATNDLGQKLRD